MSTVTNILVTAFAGEENVGIEHLGFNRVDEHAGGNKFFEMTVWLGAFNHCDTNQMIEWIRAAGWEQPEDVQIFVNEQENTRFTER